jgi:integrase/recombinase XerD
METTEFIRYLQGKDFAPSTIKTNIRYIEQFFEWAKTEAEQVTKPDILRYLEYLKSRKNLQNSSRRENLNALNHYFNCLQNNGQIDKNPCYLLKIRGQKRNTLYKTYTEQELDTLFDNFYHCFVRNFDDSRYRCGQQRELAALSRERNALILNILINQGVTTGEVEKIEINDLNLSKATLRIRGGRRSNERIMSLKATQIGLFMNYLQNIYPQLLDYQINDSYKLFLLLPQGQQKKAKNEALNNLFFQLTQKIKSIDRQFLNFNQVRASVVTSWLRTQGLRKTQYLAGHRYISSTERFLSNNLDGLIENINKLNPF